MNLIASVHVACVLSDYYAIGEDFPRLIEPSDAGKELAILKVSSHVTRVYFEELLEVFRSGLIVAEVHAFKRQAVARERICGFVGDKLLERGAARFLTLGHWRMRVL